MAERPISFGIVGSGFMGRTWAEVAAHHASGTRLAAIWGGTRAPALASDYGVPLAGSLEELLARPDVDAVVLTSPPAAHHAQTLAAAAAGKHVLNEKPMAQNVAECREMTAACRAANVRLGVVSHHRFRESPVAAKKLIDEGAIGPIRMIRVTGLECGWWDLKARGDEWKLDPRQQTAYASSAAHTCDLLRWFTGEDCIRAYGQITNFSGTPPEVGQSAMVQYTMAGGALAWYWMSYETPTPGLNSTFNLLFVGSTGIIDLDPYGTVRIGRGDSWEVVHVQQPFDPLNAVDPLRLRAYGRHLEDLSAAIRSGGDPEITGESGEKTIEMIQGAELSAARNQAVELPLP